MGGGPDGMKLEEILNAFNRPDALMDSTHINPKKYMCKLME